MYISYLYTHLHSKHPPNLPPQNGLRETGIEAHSREEESDWTSFMVCVANNKPKSLELILDWYERKHALRPKGWLELRENENNRTALMMAANLGYTECLESLVERGAKLGAKDGHGKTARMLAVEAKKKHTVAWIDEYLRVPSEDEMDIVGSATYDGLTSTQRSRNKKKELEANEKRGEKKVEEEVKKVQKRMQGKKPAAVWKEVTVVEESHEMLRPVHEMSVVRAEGSREEQGLVEGVDPAMWFLSSLNKLELKLGSRLSSISNLSYLGNLQILILTDNALTSLPADIGELTELRVLEASNNQLSSLPASLAQLTKLKTVDLSRNCLSDVSLALSGCSSLTVLNLADNELSGSLSLPLQTIPNLQELVLSDNELTELPEDIELVNLLASLKIERNQISSLPKGFGTLKKLKTFEWAENPIKDGKVVRMLKQGGKGMKDLSKYLQKGNKKGGGKKKKNKKEVVVEEVVESDSSCGVDTDEL